MNCTIRYSIRKKNDLPPLQLVLLPPRQPLIAPFNNPPIDVKQPYHDTNQHQRPATTTKPLTTLNYTKTPFCLFFQIPSYLYL